MAIDISGTPISWVKNCRSKMTKTGSVGQFIAGVQSGRWAKPVRTVREMIDLGLPKSDVNAAKGELPAVLFSGLFTYASRGGFCGMHTGIICADFDNVDAEDVIEACEDLPWVAGWFRSPSWHGLKVLCLTEAAETADHYPAWFTVQNAFADLGLAVDEQCKDYSRLCYASHYPGAVLRLAEPLKILASAPRIDELPSMGNEDSGCASLWAALLSLEQLGPAIEGQHGDLTTFKACTIGHEYGVPFDLWLAELEKWNDTCTPPWNQRELAAKCRSAYRNNKNPYGYLAMFEGII